MPKKEVLFVADQFTPTRYDTAEEKAKVANTLMNFILAGCPVEKFTDSLYKRVMYMYGHIAHYNRNGFADVFFANDQTKLRFINAIYCHPCYGVPEHTWCDVEKEIKSACLARGVREAYQQRAANECESKELQVLRTLAEKYPQQARDMLDTLQF